MAASSRVLKVWGNISPELVVLDSLEIGSKLQVNRDGKLEHSYGSSTAWYSVGIQKLSRNLTGAQTDLEKVLDRVQVIVDATTAYCNPEGKKTKTMLPIQSRKINLAGQGLKKMQKGYCKEITEATPRETLVQMERIGKIADSLLALLPKFEL